MFGKNSECKIEISDDAIAQRAYQIWQEKGCPESDGTDDWQTAQTQLLEEAKQAQRPIASFFKRLRNRAALA